MDRVLRELQNSMRNWTDTVTRSVPIITVAKKQQVSIRIITQNLRSFALTKNLYLSALTITMEIKQNLQTQI